MTEAKISERVTILLSKRHCDRCGRKVHMSAASDHTYYIDQRWGRQGNQIVVTPEVYCPTCW